MRDDNDYHLMTRDDLRFQLTRVSKELASWSFALGQSRREQNRYWIDGAKNSRAKSTTERKLDADMNAEEFTREVHENEGMVSFYTVIRDLIVELLREPDIDDLILET